MYTCILSDEINMFKLNIWHPDIINKWHNDMKNVNIKRNAKTIAQ